MVSGRLFKQLKGKNWVWNIVLTTGLFPAPLLLVFSVVNTIAWNSNSTAALPFTTICLMLAILVFIHFPSTVLGAVVGRNMTQEYRHPCRTNKATREVPDPKNWFRHPATQAFMAGFLPFSAIYIELHYIFAAIWGHKIYTLFGILFLAFIMLIIVTSFITVALLYFQLAREDHRWWWTSILNGGATWRLYFRLQLLLLRAPQQHEWSPPALLLFWLYGHRGIRILPDAWLYRLLQRLLLC